MFRRFPALILAALTALAANTALLAQDLPASPNGMAAFDQIELTEDQVDGFISSFKQLRALSAEDDTIDVDNLSEPPQAGFGAWQALATNARIQEIVTANGFADMSEWMNVGINLSIAYSFVEDGKTIEDVNAEKAEMLAAEQEILKNPNLTETQKQMFAEHLQQSMGMAARMMPTEHNLLLVEPYMPALKSIFEG